MKKNLIAMLLCIIMMAGAVIPCFAYSEAPTVQPRWDNIKNINSLISFVESNGEALGTATKKTGVTSMEGTLTVYQNVNGNWVYVNSASGSTTRNTLSVTIQFSAVSGREYKAVFEVTAYKNGVGETDSYTSYKTCP